MTPGGYAAITVSDYDDIFSSSVAENKNFTSQFDISRDNAYHDLIDNYKNHGTISRKVTSRLAYADGVTKDCYLEW